MPPEPKERLPIKITPDPITLFMAEVRFGLFAFDVADMAKPVDAQALAAKLKEKGCEQIEVEKIGTGEISAPYDRNVELARKEPAHLRAQLGPNIISLMIEGEPYPGWAVVSGQIQEWLGIVLETGIYAQRKVALYGHRINNFFRGYRDFTSITHLNMNKGPLGIYANTFEQWETSVHLKGVSHRVFLESSGEFGERQGVKLEITSGSPISPPEAFELETACARLEYLHGEEKALFFRLLKDEYLDAMNPEYGPSVQPQND